MKNKKGFTLVELIVVLVILAILAAVLIPTLSGYIKKAKTAQVLQNAGSVTTACSFFANEQLVKASPANDLDYATSTQQETLQGIIELAGLEAGTATAEDDIGEGESYLKALEFDADTGKISSIVYYYFTEDAAAAGYKCTFDGTAWTTEEVEDSDDLFS